MSFRLVADSSSNLFSFPEADFDFVSLKINCEDQEFIDTPELDIAKMNAFLKESRSRSGSSCPNVSDWLASFGDANEIFAVAITSSLSGSYAAAKNAAEEYMAEHPERKVCVIDSLSAGPELQLLIEKIHELDKTGLSFEETEQAVRNYLKKTRLAFTLKSLNNLAKNGRVSIAVATLAGVLGIQLVGAASEEGTLQPLHKCRGEARSLACVFETMKEAGYAGGKAVISHCLNLPAAEKLKEFICRVFPDASVRLVPTGGLCSFYAETGGLLVGYETL
ncbi:MAG: DegV family protein [Oscillospiraceae bacterium]|nr:DegV family protein [Oscillospiraceae bacterium]